MQVFQHLRYHAFKGIFIVLTLCRMIFLCRPCDSINRKHGFLNFSAVRVDFCCHSQGIIIEADGIIPKVRGLVVHAIIIAISDACYLRHLIRIDKPGIACLHLIAPIG